MDWTAIAEVTCVVLGGVSAVFGWLVKRTQKQLDDTIAAQGGDIKELEKSLAAYKLHVAEHYVTQGELTKAVSSLERSIERLIEAVNQNSKETREGFAQIHSRIDQKADK